MPHYNRSHGNRQCDGEVIRHLNICVTLVYPAGYSLHPAGYNTYTAGCWLSPLEYYVRLTLYPAVHEKAQPDITHIRPDVMYKRPDML